MTDSQKIDQYIASLSDWRGPLLAQVRQIIYEVDPEIIETWKWMGTPVWEHDGIVLVGMAFKTSIKLGFLYGASLADPDTLFNAELHGNQRRAIKYFEGDSINVPALKELIKASIVFNQQKRR